GGVWFAASETRAEVVVDPVLRDELAHRRGAVPVLRLVCPSDEPGPPPGFDTEVRLPLSPDTNQAELPAQAAEQAADVLLAFPALRRIELPGRVGGRAGLDGGG